MGSSSIPAASTSLTAPQTLSGVSQFSSDFQSVLNRTVAIAQLPVQQLQNRDAVVLQQEQQLATLGSSVSDLQASLANLGTLAQNQALVATSSDSSVVAVQNTGADSAASYTIGNVTSVASAASETTQAGYADANRTPVSTSGTVALKLGASTYTITLTPATNNLAGLRDAINNLGVGVSATVLTTGTGANPNYLSVTADNTGATTLQLIDDPGGANTNLLTSTNQGSDAVFELNGVPVEKASNTINDVIPGLTFTIEDTTVPNQTVNLTLSSDPSQLQSALQDFVGKYNALESAVQAQVGQNAGVLSGDFLVRQVQDDLRQLTAYQGSGSIQSLSDLGIEIDSTGQMTLDTNTLNSLSSSQLNAAFSFLGSTTSGFGGFSQQFDAISDPVTGLIALQQTSYQKTDQDLQSQINDLNSRISVMQTALTAQLEAADAFEAQLQSQQSELTATIQSLNFTSFGVPAGSSSAIG